MVGIARCLTFLGICIVFPSRIFSSTPADALLLSYTTMILAMSQLNVEFDLRIYKTLINHGLDSLNN
tara:strand:- start:202 stop:402 length:201 start_codon:yes stop_codon:yes gene_type:complete